MAERTLALRTAGSGGPAVVLVHGWGLHGGIWDEVVPALAPACRVAVVDLPGHGASAPAGADLEDWARRLGEALPGRRIWVGWSLGGLVCLQLALQRPEQVSALALVAATPRFTTAPDWSWAVPPAVLAAFSADLERDRAGTLARFLALQVRGSAGARDTLRRLRGALAQGGAPGGLQAGLDILRGTDLRGALPQVRCPVWVLGGGRDTLVPPAACRALADGVADGRLAMIPEAGHAPFVARPEAFVDGLLGFVAEVGCRDTAVREHGAP